jgi:GNAT superfamily N-acetyltransferase
VTPAAPAPPASPVPIRELRRSDRDTFGESIELGYGPFEAMVGLGSGGSGEFNALFRPGIWFLLRFTRALGKAPLRAFVAVDRNRVVGTTLLLPWKRSGYILGVGVRPEYRRRGLAGRLVSEAEQVTRRSGRPWAVLDVEEENHPAITLYLARKYTVVQRSMWYRLADRPPAPSPTEPTGSVHALRGRPDREPAAAWVAGQVGAAVAMAVPPEPSRFTHLESLGTMPGGKRAAWTVGAPGAVRGVLAGAWRSANRPGMLFLPALDPAVPKGEAVALLRAGVAWLQGLGCSGVLLAVPDTAASVAPALADLGFAPQLATLTMTLRLDGGATSAPPKAP